jgi:hypothetical protein
LEWVFVSGGVRLVLWEGGHFVGGNGRQGRGAA